MESANLDTFIKEFVEKMFDVEAKSMYSVKGIGYYCVTKLTDSYVTGLTCF